MSLTIPTILISSCLLMSVAIVGGIAEAIWGVPEQMQSEAMSYLPDDMVAIIEQFQNRKQN